MAEVSKVINLSEEEPVSNDVMMWMTVEVMTMMMMIMMMKMMTMMMMVFFSANVSLSCFSSLAFIFVCVFPLLVILLCWCGFLCWCFSFCPFFSVGVFPSVVFFPLLAFLLLVYCSDVFFFVGFFSLVTLILAHALKID